MPIVLYTVPVTFNEGKALPPTFNRVVTRSDDGGICHLSNMLDERRQTDRSLMAVQSQLAQSSQHDGDTHAISKC